MYLLISVLTLVILLITWILLVDVRKPHNFPPGPAWLPLIGNMTYFTRKHSQLKYRHLVWEDLRKTYGNIVGIKVGKQLICTVSNSESIMKVFTRSDFEGRPEGFLFQMRTFGQKLGLVFAEGEFWQRQRKFSMQHLKNFGLGGRAMAMYIEEETKILIDSLMGRCNEPIYVNDLFGVGVINVLWAIVAGERFSHDDNRLKELLRMIDKSFRSFDISGSMLNQLPLLRYVAPSLTGYRYFKTTTDNLNGFIENAIHTHKKTVTSEARDFIDSFLEKMKVNDPSFTHEQLVSICVDLFMAGSDTTTNSLTFSMFFLMKYQDVQRRVQDELDEIVGRNKWPGLDDRPRLIYTEAVLMEVIRISNVPPLGIAHRAVKTTTLSGRTIPKGTIILTNLYALHMDEDYWESPKEFIPERFIDENGKINLHEKHYLPFGYGKRRCIGEMLAKTNLFLFFTAILHNFHLKPAKEEDDYSLEFVDGLTLSPKPFHVMMIPRSKIQQ